MDRAALGRRELLRGVGGLGLLAALAGCSPSYPTQQLRIATGGAGGEYYPLGKALARAWSDELRLDTAPEVRETDGSPANIALLTRGDVEIAMSQLDVAADAYQRNSPAGAVDLRALTRIYDDVVHVVVPRDSPITSLVQLRGHRVSVGAPASGVLFFARRLLPVVGLSEAGLTPPAYYSISKAVSELQAGRIDAFLWVGALPTPDITRLATAADIRLVDLKDVAKPVQKAFPVYAPRLIAAGTYRGVDESLTTLSIRNVLVARSEMPDDVAYDLTKALFNRQAQIAVGAPSALTIDTRRGIGTEPVPLHPGAERWFREARESG